MKIKRTFLLIATTALSLFAAQKKETKVDSMVYETGAEWRIYSTDAAVKSFSLQRDLLWFVSEKSVGWMNMNSTKKADQQNFEDIGGVPAADASCCAIDASGNAWVGTKGGIALRSKDSFKLFTKSNGLPDDDIHGILVAKSGVWVATDNGVALFQAGAWKSFGVADGLAGEKVHCMINGANGTIWFGTNKGISAFEAGKWTTYNMKTGLSWNDTKALCYDPRNGNIWAAVGEKDVNMFNGKEWKTFMDVADGIVALMADSQSRIWLSCASGLMKFNGDEWVSDPNKIGITAAQVTSMYRDDKNNLWFGMEKGVLKLNNPYPY